MQPLLKAYYALRIGNHMETGDLPLKQRVADAMAAADKKTAHLLRRVRQAVDARLPRHALERTRPRLDQSDLAST